MRSDLCKRDHQLVEWNLLPAKLKIGQRCCLACHGARAIVWRAAQRGESLDMQTLADERYRQLSGEDGHVVPPGPPPRASSRSVGVGTPGETWRPVLGLNGSYEVSDHGNVRSLPRVVLRSDGRLRRFPGVILQPHIRKADGRRTVNVGPPRKVRSVLIPWLVLEAFVGPRPDGLEACHNNGNPGDDRLANLRWDTHSENILDRGRHGTDPARNRARCPQGHDLVEPNLVPKRLLAGHRICLACQRAHGGRSYAKRKGYIFDFDAEAARQYAAIVEAVAT